MIGVETLRNFADSQPSFQTTLDGSVSDVELTNHGYKNIHRRGHKNPFGPPIMVHITARIEPTKKGRSPWGLMVEGRAGPHVSSGSWFGHGAPCESEAEARLKLSEFIEHEKKWLSDSYHREIRVRGKLLVWHDGSLEAKTEDISNPF